MQTTDKPKLRATERRPARGEQRPSTMTDAERREREFKQLLYSTAWHGHAF